MPDMEEPKPRGEAIPPPERGLGRLLAALRRLTRGRRSRSRPKWERQAQRRGCIPVWADYVGGFALTPAHEVVFSEDYAVDAVERVTDPRLRVITFYEASRRYPALAHLRPLRRSEDRICPGCQGTGQVPDIAPELRNQVICWCGGLGWVPAETPDPAPQRSGSVLRRRDRVAAGGSHEVHLRIQ